MTKALKDTPKSVRWVLDFLNINCKQNECTNSWRFPSGINRELKRPPLLKSHIKKSPESIEIKDRKIIDKTKGYVWYLVAITNKKVEWIFDGKQSVPTITDFKNFFLNAGIPPEKGNELLLENGKPLKDLNTKVKRPENWFEPGYYDPPFEVELYSQLLSIWGELTRILSNMTWGTKTYDYERPAPEVLQSYTEKIKDLYLKCWKEDEVPAEDGKGYDGVEYRGRYSVVIDSMHNKEPFPHYGMIPHAIYACIMDFGINHKELHSLLKQCLYCGSFYIKNDKRKIFCGASCEKKFNAVPTENNKKRVRESRASNKEFQQKEDYQEMIKWLKSKGHTPNEAETEAHKWIIKGEKSLKEYKRTKGRMYGIS